MVPDRSSVLSFALFFLWICRSQCLSKDFAVYNCGQTISFEGLTQGSIIWEPQNSHCELFVQPATHRLRMTVLRYDRVPNCFVDLIRWACLDRGPGCSSLAYSFSVVSAAYLWDSYGKGVLFEPIHYLKLMHCGPTGSMKIYIQTVEIVEPVQNYVLLQVILPTVLLTVVTLIVVLVIVYCSRRHGRMVRRRPRSRQTRSDPPPKYKDILKYPRLSDNLDPTCPPPPSYDDAVATISRGEMLVLCSDTDSAATSSGFDNQAYVQDNMSVSSLETTASLDAVVEKGLAARSKRTLQPLSIPPSSQFSLASSVPNLYTVSKI